MYRTDRLISALLLVSALCTAGPAAAAERDLKIATSFPAGTTFVKELRKAGNTIEEETQGRVGLKIFPGGAMGTGKAVLRKIRIGQLHGAIVTANGLDRIAPQVAVYSMPFLFRNRAELAHVREHLDPVIRERVREQGFVLTGISEGGFSYLFSKEPIKDLEDLADSKIWAPEGDEISTRMFRRAGAEPVSLPLSDVYTSLQSGMIDTVTIHPTGAIAMQWHTGVNYYTDAPLSFLMAMMVLDERVFEQLEPADREVVRSVLEDKFAELDEINARDNAEALEVLRERGIEAVEPARAPDERRWEDISRRTLEAMEEEGRVDTGLLDRARERVQAYREQHDG